MRKTPAPAAVALIAALVLVGCSAGETEPAVDGDATAEATSEATEEPSAAPIEGTDENAETSDESSSEEPDLDLFFRTMDVMWRGEPRTDDEYIAAAKLACEQLEDGVPFQEGTVVEGDSDQAKANNKDMILYGSQIFCPELNPILETDE